jgi:hypothetical protein
MRQQAARNSLASGQPSRCVVMSHWAIAGVLLNFLLTLACASPVARGEEVRVWSDPSGKFKREAVFERLDGETVYLKSPAGKSFKVELGKLSAADIAYVRQVAGGRAEQLSLPRGAKATTDVTQAAPDSGAKVTTRPDTPGEPLQPGDSTAAGRDDVAERTERAGAAHEATDGDAAELLRKESLTVAEAQKLVELQASRPAFIESPDEAELDDALVAAGATPEMIRELRDDLVTKRPFGCLRIAQFLARTDSARWQAVANSFSNYLHLPGIKSITPDVATALSKFRGILCLSGLGQVDAQTATALASGECSGLLLYGLRELEPGVAKSLSSANALGLRGLTSLSVESASALVAGKTAVLNLSGLGAVEPELAEALAGCNGNLDLSGVQSLTVDAAKFLAGSSASLLDLSGLREVDVPLAKELGRYRGVLMLGGVSQLTPDLVAALSQPNLQLVLCNANVRVPEIHLTPGGLKSLVADGALHVPAYNVIVAGSTVAVADIRSPAAGQQSVRAPAGQKTPNEAAKSMATRGQVLEGEIEDVSDDPSENARAGVKAMTSRDASRLLTEANTPAPGTATFLEVPNVDRISKEAAAILAAYPGNLRLAQVKGLSPNEAKALARHQGKAFGPSFTGLPMFHDMIQLPGLEGLSASAAAELGKRRGGYYLVGGPAMQELDPGAAKGLATFQGRGLWIDVKSLCREAQEALAHVQSDLVCTGMEGVIFDSPAFVKKLVESHKDQSQPFHVWCDEMSDEACAVLCDLAAECGLEFSGLRRVSERQAELLAGFAGSVSILGPVMRDEGLGPTTRELLTRATSPRNGVDLGDPSKLTTLTVERAKVLARQRKVLGLNGLTTLSTEAAEALSQHKGALFLNGLTTLSAEAAEALSQHKGVLALNSLTTLSAEAAEALSQHRDILSLSGLITLSDETAEALSRHKGGLGLRGLTTLSDKAAEALSQHKDILVLGGLTTLSDKAAEALSQHKSGLDLSGLTTLSDKAAEALRANPEILLPQKFRH